LKESPTQRLPDESNVKPCGKFTLAAVGGLAAVLLSVKLDLPSISDALCPLVNPEPFRYSSTLLFPVSPIHRLPDESNVMPCTKCSLATFGGLIILLSVKLDLPITRDALCPLVNPEPFRYSSTLLLLASATHRFPDESNAIPSGSDKLAIVGGLAAVLLSVKLDLPIIMDALCPLVNPEPFRYSSIRWFAESETHRLPDESNVIPDGNLKLAAVGGLAAVLLSVKLDLPIIMDALCPLVNPEPFRYSSTLPF